MTLVQLTMLGIAAVYLSLITFTLMFTIFKAIKGGNTRVFVASMATFIFFDLCGLCYFLHSLMETWYGNLLAIRSIAGALYLLGQLSMLLTFIIRIDFVFKGSSLQISSCTVKLLYCSWAGLIIFGFLTLFGSAKSPTLLLVFGVSWLLLYIGLSVKLVTMFAGKLKAFMVQKTAVSTTKSVIDMELLSVAIKNGLLATIAIVSTVFFNILLSVMRELFLDSNSFYVAQLLDDVLVIDCVTNATCLYLLFGSNGYIYNKVCFRCHGICEKWQLDDIKETETKVNEIIKTTSYSTEIMEAMEATGTATIVVSVQSDKSIATGTAPSETMQSAKPT